MSCSSFSVNEQLKGDYMFNKNATFYENFLNVAKLRNKAPAIYYEGKTISYKELLKLINRFSAFFTKSGLKENDLITLVAPNTPEAVAAFYAASQCGLKIHILHPLTIPENIIREYHDKNSKLLITSSLFLNNYSRIIEEKIPILAIGPADSLGFFKEKAFALMNKDKLTVYNGHREIRNYLKNVRHLDPQESYVNYDVREGRVVLSSGGTTGISKSILLSDFAFNAIIVNSPWFMENSAPDFFYDKTMLAVLPMFHGFGLTMGVMCLLSSGGRIALLPKFHTRYVISLLKKGRLTFMIGVPAIYEAMLKNKDFHGEIVRPLRQCWVGGDFISPSLLKRFNRRLEESGSEGRLMEGYGLTETVTVLCVNRLHDHKDGSIGRPLPNVRVRILDEKHQVLPVNAIGEIAVSGETLMNGYIHEADPFILIDKEKYICTGDIGRLDEDGFLYFISRKKRIIKKKGLNIYPLEIEKKVSEHNAVLDCAYLGETYKGRDYTVLYLSLHPGSEEKKVNEEIKSDLASSFNSYEVPDEIIIREKLPHTDVGKVDYKSLGTDFHAHLVEEFGE